jgi:uncharacterized repeat protein (TIGR01451 family)
MFKRRALGPTGKSSVLAVAVLFVSALIHGVAASPAIAAGKAVPPGSLDARVNGVAEMKSALEASADRGLRSRSAASRSRQTASAMQAAAAALAARVPGAEVTFSSLTGGPEMIRATRGPLTAPAPGKAGIRVVRDFLRSNSGLYALSAGEVDGLAFLGESLSKANGLRMVRVEQRINGVPVFQTDSRFLIRRDGALVKSLALLVPDAARNAEPVRDMINPRQALVSAMKSIGADVAPTSIQERGEELISSDAFVAGPVSVKVVYFPLTPSLLVPAWSLTVFTSGDQDWYTIVDGRSGTVLWRKPIRDYASTQEARFSVYVQADGTTPADSPAPQSPSGAVVGAGTQFPEIARTIVNMSAAQDIAASPNGWIADCPAGGCTANETQTLGNNVLACMDRTVGGALTNVCDVDAAGVLDGNGRPTGNPDANTRNRDFLGAAPRDFSYAPAPSAGNPDAGDDPTGVAATQISFRRGAVTQLFYISNWYHDQLFNLGFDEAAGNFQLTNFSGMGVGGDRVLGDAQDGSSTNNANFSTPADGASGRMQMFRFTGSAPDRDGDLDAEIVMHELTHGTSNRLIGNAVGLQWDPGRGMGEGWSDFVALSLLNHTNADSPTGNYASGAYATYKLQYTAVDFLTDNYVYGIRRFPYTPNNAINPMTWADVDDITNNLSGGITPTPVPFNTSGGAEVHNSGEIWALTLWEVRSRVIADPAGANGDVPTGNQTMLQLVIDALKMTPINPSFTDARDALIDADCAANANCPNEQWIWDGFADRGLGYKAVSPLGTIGPSRAGTRGRIPVGESFSVPHLDFASVAIDDSAGNNNGAIDPGEPVFLTVTLNNPWRSPSKDVASAAATLSTGTAGVTVFDNTAAYGAIPAQGSTAGSDTFLITVDPTVPCGSSIHFDVATTSSLGPATASFTVRVGAASGTSAPVTYTRAIPGGLAVPDANLLGVTDTFNITDDLEIADLDFRVDSMTHTYMGDIAFVLKGPTGYGTELIHHRGVFFSVAFADGNNFLNTVIDGDLAPSAATDLNQQPAAAAPFTGSFLPAFNSPIWALFGVTNFVADATDQLSRWDGTSTQGNWQIHVTDRASPDTGTVNTWSLIVTPVNFVCSAFAGAADVTGTKTVSGTFREGGAITYTVTLTNNGTAGQPDNATDEFTDVLPPKLTLVSATATSGTATATIGTNTVTWNGALAPLGGSVTITINATVVTNGTAHGTTISNQGTASFDTNGDGTNDGSNLTDDPAVAGAADPTSFQVAAGASIGATKVVSGAFHEGGAITYTVVVSNSGGDQGDNPGNEFTDTLPASLTLVNANATSGTAGTAANTVTWNGAIPAGGLVTITINATVNAGTAGSTISNQGTVTYDHNGDGTNTIAIQTDNPFVVGGPDPTSFTVASGAVIGATKTVSGTLAAGGSIVYTVVISNTGGDQADNAGNEFTDVLPSSLTLVSASATSGTAVATVGTNTVTWNGAMPGGGSVTITINATINAGTGGQTISNQGTATADLNGDLVNEAAIQTDDPGTAAAQDPTSFQVANGAVLSANKAVTGTFKEGGAITYTVVIDNVGAGAQADNPGNEFTDVLPASLTLVSASATSGTAVATVATNTVTWNGTIAAGGSVTLTINATIKTGTAATIVSNQGGLSFDSNGDGTNDSAASTDDPGTAAADDPTAFTVDQLDVVVIPTLSQLGIAAFGLLLTLAALLILRQRGV